MSMVQKATLNPNTLWQIGLTFKKNGQMTSRVATRVRFVDDINYEPPQGRIFIEDDFNGIIKVDENGYSGMWTLSEDKNDRKDGLWIWGLFEEPKYPYIYFYLDVYDTYYSDNNEKPIYPGETIPNNRLFFRFDHSIDKRIGVTLENGEMTYKLSEYVNADPFGVGGKVDVGDVVVAGIVNIAPFFQEAAVKE
eukprot:gene17567-23133_t